MFLFVGETPSKTAKQKLWTWMDGRLAAKQLFDALRSAGIDPDNQQFVNLFTGPKGRINRTILLGIRHMAGVTVVAMGNKVADALKVAEVEHKQIVHPAARGKIRLKANYAAHVLSVLKGA